MRALCLISLVLVMVTAGHAATVQQAELGSSASEDSCAITNPSTAFPASTRQVFFRFVARNVRPSDALTVEWLDPAGAVSATAPYEQLPASASLCLLTQLPVGGFAPANSPGQWTVRVTANGNTILSRSFRILPDGSAGTLRITHVATHEIGPRQNELVVEGAGFNMESIIHVAQYSSTGGWKYIAHMFPRMQNASRMTAQLAALPPAEYVVFVKNGEQLSAPARFLISTAGYHLPFPPKEQWVVSQPPYGMYSHWGRTLHAYDIAPRGGGCVVAMRAGTAYTFDRGYGQTPHLRIFGNYITIQHDDGEYSHYGHLKTGTFRVRNGEHVEQGQALAIAGTSGYSFGTHVHVQVTRAFAISSQSIPFEMEDLPAAQRHGYRGPVESANRSAYGDCSGGPRPAQPVYLSTTSAGKPGTAPASAPTWSASVPVAGWWSELTQIPMGAKSLEVRLGWESADRDFDLHLVSPSGRHYGPYADQTGYTASAGPSESFEIMNPEPGLWRVSVQGIRGNGEAMPFQVFRSVSTATPGRAWGGARRP
ncbi:MAG: peptidoglycan DD-metalloendopeptidase family protein [Bryobacterales bacterium]|nr:peptidoglycan DD-metalloendopeptidase family protein [Bryobacterales bacterium]